MLRTTTFFLTVQVSQRFECVVFLEVVLGLSSVGENRVSISSSKPYVLQEGTKLLFVDSLSFTEFTKCLILCAGETIESRGDHREPGSRGLMVSALVELPVKWEC